jgi:diamine N-acetyltransferase
VIRLVELTADNWRTCAELRLHPDQKEFVRDNLFSIAEAQFYPDAHARAIYNAEDVMVGFVLYGRDDETGDWYIFRFMIDAEHQGKGYGRAALNEVVRVLVDTHGAEAIRLSYHEHNEAARRLYGAYGFGDVGRKPDNPAMIIAALRVQ